MTRSLKKYFPVFCGPTLIAFTIAFLIPFVVGVYLSFNKFTAIDDAEWVGLKNYAAAFSERSHFVEALTFTAMVTAVAIVTVNIGAFTLAYMLTRKLRGTNVFRTVFFLPNLIGGLVLGYTWQTMLNAIINRFAEGSIQDDWRYGFAGLVLLTSWQMMGYMMIIYIAGLQNVPPELIEAAQIDGASKWQAMRSVTLPIMMPSITICTFLTLANTFKMYDQNLALTDGKPYKETQMAALNIFKRMFDIRNGEGTAQAMAVIFFIVVAVIAFIQLRVTRSKEVDQ